MILRRLGGGNEAFTYVEEADNDANKNSALIQNWYYTVFVLLDYRRNESDKSMGKRGYFS